MIGGRIPNVGTDAPMPPKPVDVQPKFDPASSAAGRSVPAPDLTTAKPAAFDTKAGSTLAGDASSLRFGLPQETAGEMPFRTSESSNRGNGEGSFARFDDADDSFVPFAVRDEDAAPARTVTQDSGTGSGGGRAARVFDADDENNARRTETSADDKQDAPRAPNTVVPRVARDSDEPVLAVKSGDGALGRKVHDDKKDDIKALTGGKPVVIRRTVIDHIVRYIATRNFFTGTTSNPADVLKNNNGYIFRNKQLEEERGNEVTSAKAASKVAAYAVNYFTNLRAK